MSYTNFERHLQKIYSQIYNEPHSEPHTTASINMIDEFCSDISFDSVVEFGCGTAPILDKMKELGKTTLGVTLGGENVNHEVIREDMHFTTIGDGYCDMVVARHVLEHSPMPLILLMEMRRIAKYYALVAVPIPDTRTINHPNHYSVFPSRNWEYLFSLAGWKVLKFKAVDYCIEPEYTYREYRYLLKAV